MLLLRFRELVFANKEAPPAGRALLSWAGTPFLSAASTR